MPRDIPIGNGSLLIAFDQESCRPSRMRVGKLILGQLNHRWAL